MAAHTPPPIQIEAFFGAQIGEDLHWKCYKISNIPAGDDCRLAILVDGHGDALTTHDPASKGVEYVRYRMDNDDDGRVKSILKAQGLPIKPGIVTYRIEANISSTPVDTGSLEFGRDLHFVHGASAVSFTELAFSTPMVKGVEHPLEDRILGDLDWLSQPNRPELPEAGTSDERAFAPFVRKNLAHHVRFTVTLVPHKVRRGNDGASSFVTSI